MFANSSPWHAQARLEVNNRPGWPARDISDIIVSITEYTGPAVGASIRASDTTEAHLGECKHKQTAQAGLCSIHEPLSKCDSILTLLSRVGIEIH